MSTMQVAKMIWWSCTMKGEEGWMGSSEGWHRGLRGHMVMLSPWSDCSQALVCWRCFGKCLVIVSLFCDSAAGGQVSSCLSFYASLSLILCHRLQCPLSLGLWKHMEGLPMAILLVEGKWEERIQRKKGHFENKDGIETRALSLSLLVLLHSGVFHQISSIYVD